MIDITAAAIGLYATNCYIITDTVTGLSAAVDCAVFNGDFERLLRRANVSQLEYILLTHGHFDHICGVKTLQEKYGGKICISENDAPCLSDEYKSLNASMGYAAQGLTQADILLHNEDIITLGETKIRVISTPGHTAGSVCFVTEGGIFSGDTLFRLSVGRVDLPGGNKRDLINSLKKLAEISGEHRVFPGHGSTTLLSFEKAHNSFIH